MLLELYLVLQYLLEELLLVLGLEGAVSVQDGVEEDAEGPAVGQQGAVRLFGNDFGGHVGGRSAEDVGKLLPNF